MAAGIHVVAITPDAAPILQAFATAHHLTYPLLSDIGGKVIQAFGLLNPNIPPNPRQATGQPFPGHFLIAPDGTVLAKAFTGDLRHRVSGSTLVLEYAGATEESAVTIANDVLHARITLSSTRLFGGQEIAVVVDLDIVDGWHVYAESVAAPYTPLSINIDTDGELLARQHFTMPTPVLLEFESTGETLPVHEGQRPHLRPSAPSMEPAAEHVRRPRRGGESARDHARCVSTPGHLALPGLQRRGLSRAPGRAVRVADRRRAERVRRP